MLFFPFTAKPKLEIAKIAFGYLYLFFYSTNQIWQFFLHQQSQDLKIAMNLETLERTITGKNVNSLSNKSFQSIKPYKHSDGPQRVGNFGGILNLPLYFFND
jgi:hypothetical protein